VIHCRDAYGLIIEHATHGWKLVYSGDTRPCPRLIAAGRDCTVLVHEATFEDALVAEAIDKNHSTTGEAVASGTEMRAWRTVLTHFSQRYPKVPVFDESHRSCTCVAFDLMRIRMKDLATLPCILPTVRLLFQEEEKEDSKDEDADDTL
jgi:ribonuclease Z